MIILDKNYFGSNFIKYKKEGLSVYSFTEETKKFLVNFGLPENFKKISSSEIYFYSAEKFIRYRINNEEYIQIGETMKRPFFIKIKDQGFYGLFIDYLTKSKKVELINSSVKNFLLFYQIRIFLFENRDLKKNSNWAEKLGEELREILPKIDSKAFEKEESWWDQLVSEYEDGYY